MNKIKRIGSAILAVLLMVTALTGCGVNELGYFKLSGEASGLSEYSFENKISLELGEQILGKDIILDLVFKGAVNLENLNSMYMDANISMNLNNTKLINEINLKIAENKVYISKEFLGAYLEIADLIADPEDPYIGNKKILEELYNNNLKDVDYILLGDIESLYDNLLVTETTEIPYKEITDISMDYLMKAFNGFDSKIFRKTFKGYAMELDADEALTLAENLLDYTYKNKEAVFDETVKYLEALSGLFNSDEITEEDKELLTEKLNEIKQEFFDRISVALFFVRSEEAQGNLDFVKGSKISSEIYKEGKSYISKGDIELSIENKKIFKITSEAEAKPAKVEITKFTGKAIEMKEYERLAEEVSDRINPVVTLNIFWLQGADTVGIYETRALDVNSGFSTQPYTMRDERMYLPLRYVSEAFGEEVEWDELNSKAYIIRGAEKIDMTGIIVDSETMVKIRDFEKLGYEIVYEQSEGLSSAAIKRIIK